MTSATGKVPYLTVVRGEPTDVELAAVVTVLATRGAADQVAKARAGSRAGSGSGRSEWASRHRLMRQPVHAGPGAWRASARGW